MSYEPAVLLTASTTTKQRQQQRAFRAPAVTWVSSVGKVLGCTCTYVDFANISNPYLPTVTGGVSDMLTSAA